MLSCLLHAGPAVSPGPSGGYEKGDNLIFTIYDEDSDLTGSLRDLREPVEWSKKMCSKNPKTKFCDNRKLRPFEGLILQGGLSLLSASKVVMIR